MAKAKWRESMKRKVSTVLLLLCNNSEKQTELFLLSFAAFLQHISGT